MHSKLGVLIRTWLKGSVELAPTPFLTYQHLLTHPHCVLGFVFIFACINQVLDISVPCPCIPSISGLSQKSQSLICKFYLASERPCLGAPPQVSPDSSIHEFSAVFNSLVLLALRNVSATPTQSWNTSHIRSQ